MVLLELFTLNVKVVIFEFYTRLVAEVSSLVLLS